MTADPTNPPAQIQTAATPNETTEMTVDDMSTTSPATQGNTAAAAPSAEQQAREEDLLRRVVAAPTVLTDTN